MVANLFVTITNDAYQFFRIIAFDANGLDIHWSAPVAGYRPTHPHTHYHYWQLHDNVFVLLAYARSINF